MTDTQRIKSSAVKATTDLGRVKLVADMLLKMEVGKTEMSPIVVTHPFTSSGIVGVRGDHGMEVLDILSSKDDLKRWRDCMHEGIRTADNAIQIFIMLNKPYYDGKYYHVVSNTGMHHYMSPWRLFHTKEEAVASLLDAGASEAQEAQG